MCDSEESKYVHIFQTCVSSFVNEHITRTRLLTWGKKVPDFRISFRKRVEEPSTSGKESLMLEVIVIGQGSKAMNPEANSFHLCAIESRIGLQPVGSCECQSGEHYCDELHSRNLFGVNAP
jgi:hypothetical protein